jgi:hypothetical protein
MQERFRKGMWVMAKAKDGTEHIGILNSVDRVFGEVHLVQDNGETNTVVVFALTDVRQAKVEEIPESRRPAPELAARLGY